MEVSQACHLQVGRACVRKSKEKESRLVSGELHLFKRLFAERTGCTPSGSAQEEKMTQGSF